MNVSDSERVLSRLEDAGYSMTEDEDSADVILFNTCSVREKAEHKLYTRVGEIRKTYSDAGDRKIVGVLGCVAQLEGDNLFKNDRGIDLVLGTRAVGRVSEVIQRSSGGEQRVIDLGEREPSYEWDVPARQRHSPYVAFVPIIEGCNKFCTYCIVPFSRGREKSLSASVIVRQVLELKRENVLEVHLIGQNVNSYRPLNEAGLEEFPGATPFSRLLRAVAATGIKRVKFTTSFPRDFHPDILRAMDEYPNLCNWVHLPVQSGSDRVLRMMRRGHTVESYMKKIDLIRASERDISLTTDLIVGFPGETEEDFAGTLALYQHCRFDGAYIFKYSPRPGTPAAELRDNVPGEEKTRRFLELDGLRKRFQAESLGRTVGSTMSVLAERPSAMDEAHLSGHTTCHRTVNFDAAGEKPGRIHNVKITMAKSNSLFGQSV